MDFREHLPQRMFTQNAYCTGPISQGVLYGKAHPIGIMRQIRLTPVGGCMRLRTGAIQAAKTTCHSSRFIAARHTAISRGARKASLTHERGSVVRRGCTGPDTGVWYGAYKPTVGDRKGYPFLEQG